MTTFVRVITGTIALSLVAAVPAAAQMRSGYEWENPVSIIAPGSLNAVNGGTYKTHGAIAGFLLGAGVTAIVIHSGGSTSLCDRSANQDAMNSAECAGLIAAGGLVGGVAGYFIGGRIHRDVRLEVVPHVSPRGSYFLFGLRESGALIRAAASRRRSSECAHSICGSAASAF